MAYTPIYNPVNFVDWAPPDIDAENLNAIEDALVSLGNGLQTAAEDTDTNTADIATINGEISDINDLIAEMFPVDSASGNPAVITDAFGGECKSLVLTLEPIQSGSGTPSPSNVRPISGRSSATIDRYGKNLFDAALMVSPATSAKWVQVVLTPNTTYTVSSNIPNSYTSAYIFAIAGTETSGVTSGVNGVGQNRPQTITTGDDGIVSIGYRTNGESGVLNLSNYTYQIEVGSTATDYEPYNGESITRTYGTTIYGGSDDVTGDGAVSTYNLVNLSDLSWSDQGTPNTYQATISDLIVPNNDIVCSHYPTTEATTSAANMPDKSIKTYGLSNLHTAIVKDSDYPTLASFTASLTGVQLAYPTTSPTPIPLTAQNITLLHGDNVLTTDADSIEASYSADIALYIDKKIAEGSQSRSVDSSSLTKSGSTEETEEVTKTIENEEAEK